MLYNSFITNWKKNKQKLVTNHVYNELNEHSSCGVGLIASLQGIPKKEVVEICNNLLANTVIEDYKITDSKE